MKLDLDTAALLLDVLGNQTRLKIARMLVRAGDGGMTVGDIQRNLKIPASTLSHHLNHLRSVGLIWQEREGTLLHCCADYKLIDALVRFLTEECCAGSVRQSGKAPDAIETTLLRTTFRVNGNSGFA